MNRAIEHRGPDANKFMIFDDCTAFGHLRLSIIDTERRSDQPMTSSSGRYTIVFNGEIYNFASLKENLNYPFKTQSDTEVILAYLDLFDIETFLKKSNGMFAMAIFDHKNNSITIARDRLGIKPLYFHKSKDYFIFSSEINGILKSGLLEPNFNTKAIDDYLAYRYVREPNTFFKEINQLKSGHYLTISSDLSVQSTKYWDFPNNFNTEEDYSEEEIRETFKTKLNKAISLRLMSDVELGTYLSGGIDSSLITAITAIKAKQAGKSLNTYTIGFDDLNEFEFAKIISQKYDTKHHEIVQKKEEFFALNEAIIKYKGSPLSVPNEIPLSQMSKILKENITVVLSGEGADELMGGYGKIFRSAFDFKNHINDMTFYQYFTKNYEYTPRSIRDDFLSSKENYRNDIDKQIENEFSTCSNEENIFRFFHKYHIKGLLSRLDTTTMLASVEARVPFLDHELIEYAYNNIPYKLKLKWRNKESEAKAKSLFSNEYSEELDIPKFLLRDIAYDYLPKELVDRKKMGFPVPLNEWVELIIEKALVVLPKADWLNTNLLEELIDRAKTNDRFGQILWMFLNIELFKSLYFNHKWKY